MTAKFFRRRNRDRAPSSGNSSTNPPATAGPTATAVAAAIPSPPSPFPTTPAVATAVPIRAIHVPSLTSTAPLSCHTCREPITRDTRHIHTSRSLSGERRYHRACFLCLHCGAPIDPQSQSFCYAKLNREGGSGHGSGHGGGSGHDLPYDDDEHPFHKECFALHFGWMCVVCEKPLPMVTKFNNAVPTNENVGDGAGGYDTNNNNNNNNGNAGGGKSTKVEFLKHPFFDNERMCPHHANPNSSSNNAPNSDPFLPGGSNHDNERLPGGNHDNDRGRRSSINTATTEEVIGEIRRCAGCHRFEPLFASAAKHFIDVGDSDTGRCVCLACCRTVITTSDDVVPLWDKVIDFFEGPLGLITSEDSAGDALRDRTYNNKKVGVTRQDLKNIPIMVVGMEALNDNMKRDSVAHFGSNQIMTRGLCLSEHTSHGPDSGIGVTAILCLSGLPSDLTASILAHEAAHAWIKLHPNFPYTDPLPLKVEEGICQLVAFLFLNDGLDPIIEHHRNASSSSSSRRSSTTDEADDSIPSDAKLRQYFRFCIETDEGVYGEGFRLAARAYAKMGIQELLYHVALHHEFPT